MKSLFFLVLVIIGTNAFSEETIINVIPTDIESSAIVGRVLGLYERVQSAELNVKAYPNDSRFANELKELKSQTNRLHTTLKTLMKKMEEGELPSISCTYELCKISSL